MWRAALEAVVAGPTPVLSDVDQRAVRGLKFSAALPRRLAVATQSARLADFDGATAVLAQPQRLSNVR